MKGTDQVVTGKVSKRDLGIFEIALEKSDVINCRVQFEDKIKF